jgi:hypothetical protein
MPHALTYPPTMPADDTYTDDHDAHAQRKDPGQRFLGGFNRQAAHLSHPYLKDHPERTTAYQDHDQHNDRDFSATTVGSLSLSHAEHLGFT